MTQQRTNPLVLVADDQVPTTMMLQRVFEYEGYEVECVYDGAAALKQARELLPDLVLLDVNMPEMSGFEVLKHLREDPGTANIPTILITAMGELNEVVHGLTLGADDYVRKPFHPRELLARAETKMKARKLEEALQRRTQELEALLRVSDVLNQILAVPELLELIPTLMLELLPGKFAAIYQLADDESLADYRVRSAVKLNLKHPQIVKRFLKHNAPMMWEAEAPVMPELPYGMATPLHYADGGVTQAVLLIGSDNPYDEKHLELLKGIGRQANLALHNAELYKIQANYALHLEDMVNEKTHELRDAQQMLIRAEKLASVGRLAASIAHEINNPLLPIQINLDDMLEDLQSGKHINPEEIVRTQESVERIGRVVRRLLEYTGRSHSAGYNATRVDINRLIVNISDLVRKSLEQQGKTIALHLGELPLTYADKDGLEQVFMNLLLNAAEAMGKGGTVSITTSPQKDQIIIKVQDTGVGIPQEMIDTIFEPFVSTKEDGNGLGLFISYGIIENHHGTIEVESKLNVGTTFTIRLPLHNEPISVNEQGHR